MISLKFDVVFHRLERQCREHRPRAPIHRGADPGFAVQRSAIDEFKVRMAAARYKARSFHSRSQMCMALPLRPAKPHAAGAV